MSEPLSLPPTLWPERDRKLWHETFANPDDWLERSRPAAWKPRTREQASNHYGRWLQWLREVHKLDAGARPPDRMRPELVTEFVKAELTRVRAATVSNTLFHLIGLAETWAPGDWAWLRAIRARVKRKAAREPRPQRQYPTAQAIFDLALELMKQACARQSEGAIDAALYIEGLMIAVLIASRLRITNFSDLELKRHLRRGEARWFLTVAAEETKTEQAHNDVLPFTLTPMMDFYVNTIRTLLIDRREPGSPEPLALWIGIDGKPLLVQTIRKRIKRRTREAFGQAVNPHAFRKSAVRTLIVERPEYVFHGQALLGHRSGRTTEKYYMGAQRQLARQTYHALLNRCCTGSVKDPTADRNDFERRVRTIIACAPPDRSTGRGRPKTGPRTDGRRARRLRRRPEVERPLDPISDDEILTHDSNDEMPPLVDTDAMRPRGRVRPPVAPDDRPDDDEQPF